MLLRKMNLRRRSHNMIVTVYSYTQIECSKCKKLSVIQPGKFDTNDIFKLSCGCDEEIIKKVSNGKQTKKDSEES